MSHAQPFVVQERVRWADVDLVGIMRFSAFTRLVELAEQELLRAAGLPYGEIMAQPAYWMPRRALTFEYFARARIDELLTLVIWVSHIGTSSVGYTLEVRQSGRDTDPRSGTLVALATMTTVAVTAADFEKCPVPAEWVQAIAPYYVPGDESGKPTARSG